MSEWITLPSPPLLARGAPGFVNDGDLDAVRALTEAANGAIVEVSLAEVGDARSVVDVMKGVLPFPSWCGSSWDSVDDALQELVDSWTFPLVMIVHGMPLLLSRNGPVGIQTAIRLNELACALSTAGEQLAVVYAADRW